MGGIHCFSYFILRRRQQSLLAMSTYPLTERFHITNDDLVRYILSLGRVPPVTIAHAVNCHDTCYKATSNDHCVSKNS